MAGQRYKPGVNPVLVLGIERPALAAALAGRGMVARAAAAGAIVALVREDGDRPSCPALVEASSVEAASALLDGGADDVVLRSDPDSLVAARLAALLRRARPEVVQVGDIAIDTVERRVTQAGQSMALLPREYQLLLYLARHPGVAVAQATLHRALWGRDFDPGTNVIAVHVSRLRAKLGGGVRITTDRGKGYRLTATVAGSGQGG